MDTNLSNLWEIVTEEPGMLQSTGSQRVKTGSSKEEQRNNNKAYYQLMVI